MQYAAVYCTWELQYKCRNARSFPVAMLEVTDSGFCPTGEVRTLSGLTCLHCMSWMMWSLFQSKAKSAWTEPRSAEGSAGLESVISRLLPKTLLRITSNILHTFIQNILEQLKRHLKQLVATFACRTSESPFFIDHPLSVVVFHQEMLKRLEGQLDIARLMG